MVVLMHGVGSNELSMAALAPAFDDRFLVLSVRSPTETAPFSFAWLDVTQTTDGPIIDPTEVDAAIARLTTFIEEACSAYEADPGRVYVAGFSQGGIMALATLLITPERVSGAVCMSGRLPPEVLAKAASPERLRGKPALIVHGTRDDTLEVGYARAADQALRRLQLEVEYEELDIGHVATDESLALVTTWLSDRLGS
jgi:phospholipase/carboxylesterase